jgi:putative polyhydroxyalkanoate system protein
MATISIQHTHKQNEKIVREALQKLLGELKEEYQITSTWHGHTIEFHRTGASGRLTIKPHQVDVEIKLNMMLSMFERKIREAITTFCKEHLR